MPKRSTSPSASLAVGVNEYGVPATTLAGGVPEMTGGVLAPADALWKKSATPTKAVAIRIAFRCMIYTPSLESARSLALASLRRIGPECDAQDRGT